MSADPSNAPIGSGSTPLPTGLISFLYNAVYNPVTNASCKSDIQSTLQSFGIQPTNPAYGAILQMQMAGSGQDAFDLTVFAKCVAYLTTQTQDADTLQVQKNTLGLSEGVCMNLVSAYPDIW